MDRGDRLGSENCGDDVIAGAVIDHLEVVEVVELIGGVLLIVDAEGDHVVLGPAGLGHGDGDVIAVGHVELCLKVEPVDVGRVVQDAGNPVDGDLPQAQTGQIVADLVHALHGDDEGLGIEDGLHVHAGCGHGEGKGIAVGIEARHGDIVNRDAGAVVLAGDDELAVKLCGVEAVAVAVGDDDHHLSARLAGVGGLPVAVGIQDLVADGADAGNGSGTHGDLAGLKVGLNGVLDDLAVGIGDLEVAVGIGLVLHLLKQLGDFCLLSCGGCACVGRHDLVLDEGHAVCDRSAQIHVLKHGDGGGLVVLAGELHALFLAAFLVGDGEAAVAVAGGGRGLSVHEDLAADDGGRRSRDDRGDGDAALGHLESAAQICPGRDGDLEAVAVADHVVLDLVAALDFVAVLVIGREDDDFVGILVGDDKILIDRIRNIAGIVKGVNVADLGRHDQDVVALGAESDTHVHVEGGHGEAVAEDVDELRRIAVLVDDQLNRLVPVHCLGNDRDACALGRAGHGIAVDLQVEAAACGRGLDHVEGVRGDRREDDFDIHIRIGHDEGPGAAHGERGLRGGGDHLLVVGIHSRDLIIGIGALDDDCRALDRGRDGHAADGGRSLAAVVGGDVDVMAGLDGGVHTDVAARHHEGVAGQVQVGGAVGVLDREALDGPAGIGLGHDGDLRAGRSGGNGLVVHVEEHSAVRGGHAAREGVELGRGGRARGGRAVAVGDGGDSGRRGGSAGVAGAGHGDRQRHGVEEVRPGPDRREVVRLVQRLEQKLVGVVGDTLGADDAVGSVTAGDHMLHNTVAGGAHDRAHRRRDDDGVPCSHLAPVGDVVHLLDERIEDGEVDAQVVAHAGDSLAVGHGVGHQVVGKRIRGLGGREVRRGRGADRAGGGSAGDRSGRGGGCGGTRVIGGRARTVCDQDCIIIARRQSQDSADSQLAPLAVINVVEDHDSVLARIVVQT